jgi:cobalamin-dependent methionine synthase I
MAEAVILDSGASILAEQCAGILEEIIRTQMGGFATGRYSPGYGDFPIEMQGQLIKAVDGPKTIGLTTNESYILIPRKSITAIIGMADHPVTGYLATCDECLLKESCRLRASGTPCFK